MRKINLLTILLFLASLCSYSITAYAASSILQACATKVTIHNTLSVPVYYGACAHGSPTEFPKIKSNSTGDVFTESLGAKSMHSSSNQTENTARILHLCTEGNDGELHSIAILHFTPNMKWTVTKNCERTEINGTSIQNRSGYTISTESHSQSESDSTTTTTWKIKIS